MHNENCSVSFRNKNTYLIKKINIIYDKIIYKNLIFVFMQYLRRIKSILKINISAVLP